MLLAAAQRYALFAAFADAAMLRVDAAVFTLYTLLRLLRRRCHYLRRAACL